MEFGQNTCMIPITRVYNTITVTTLSVSSHREGKSGLKTARAHWCLLNSFVRWLVFILYVGLTPPMLVWATQGDVYTTSWSTQLLIAVCLKQRSSPVPFVLRYTQLLCIILWASWAHCPCPCPLSVFFHGRDLLVSHTSWLSNKSPVKKKKIRYKYWETKPPLNRFSWISQAVTVLRATLWAWGYLVPKGRCRCGSAPFSSTPGKLLSCSLPGTVPDSYSLPNLGNFWGQLGGMDWIRIRVHANNLAGWTIELWCPWTCHGPVSVTGLDALRGSQNYLDARGIGEKYIAEYP